MLGHAPAYVHGSGADARVALRALFETLLAFAVTAIAEQRTCWRSGGLQGRVPGLLPRVPLRVRLGPPLDEPVAGVLSGFVTGFRLLDE
ncbi:MAG: hypothetical protein ACK4YP_04125, partial [Myxococcota bacterium]